MSVGNRGLQLLQAAAAEFCCIRPPILRQFFGAQWFWCWRLFRFRGWWGSSWGWGGLRAGDAGGGGSSNCRGSLLSGVD